VFIGDNLLPAQVQGSIDDAQDGDFPVKPSHDRHAFRIAE